MAANTFDFCKININEIIKNLAIELHGDQPIPNEGSVDDDYYLNFFLKCFEYVSFDAKTTASQFREKAAQNPITAGDTPTLRYGTMQLYKKCDGASDLRFFINLFLKGGNNLPKILARAEPSAAAVIRRKCSAYGIDYRSARLNKDRGIKNMTLSRIARAFSVDTAMEILRIKSRGILTSQLFKRELPLVMQHNIFTGLIPASQFTEDLKGIALILNMEISLKLGSPEEKEKMKEKTVGELIESSAKYVDEAIQSGVYDDAAKFKILTEAGVLNTKDNGEFELSATTIELMNELPAIKAVYTLKYPDAVRQLESNIFF